MDTRDSDLAKGLESAHSEHIVPSVQCLTRRCQSDNLHSHKVTYGLA